MKLRIAGLHQRKAISQWLQGLGIYRDLYELGYDLGDISLAEPHKAVELVPVLRIVDGVLSDVDVTEFVLKFGV